MKLKRLSVILCAALLAAAASMYLLVQSWSSTPHGKLNYRVAIYLKLTNAAENSVRTLNLPVEESRRNLAERSASVSSTPPKLASVKNLKARHGSRDVPLRVYTPGGSALYPALMFYHGGGWVQGGIDTHDSLCRVLAVKSGAVVISVEYRLAPEHPFPAAAEDSYGAFRWVHSQAKLLDIDPEKIAVAGDSAGGNLAAAVTLMSRDRKGPPIVFQALIYPGVNSSVLDTESYRNFARGYILDKAAVERFIAFYLPDEKDRLHPYASPLLAKDHRFLPPALVITAEFDVLRDEGEAYVEKLKSAGVKARAVRYPGMIHGFVSADKLLPQARRATDEIGAELRKAFSGKL